MCRKGAVSTWGIDLAKMTLWEQREGFKYFRIV